jgi:hypothetical protein
MSVGGFKHSCGGVLCQVLEIKASEARVRSCGTCCRAWKTRSDPGENVFWQKLTPMFNASKDTDDSLSVTEETCPDDTSSNVERRRPLEARLAVIGLLTLEKCRWPVSRPPLG